MTDMVENTSEVNGSHNQWDNISCPICMDHPHNAVLIICSAHDKGCRSYICDTSYRHSNCLDRFKKLRLNNSGNVHPTQLPSSFIFRNLVENNNEDVNSNMKCPLCRGAVLGWMVVKEAREYFDLKPRSCSRESCSFSGNYKELRRHARRVHPTTRPADVDPTRQRAWHHLENQSEYGDVISALRSEMPGALVLGDYVIDTGDHDVNVASDTRGQWLTPAFLFMLDAPIRTRNEPRGSSRSWRAHRRLRLEDDRPIPRRRRRRFVRSRHNEEQP